MKIPLSRRKFVVVGLGAAGLGSIALSLPTAKLEASASTMDDFIDLVAMPIEKRLTGTRRSGQYALGYNETTPGPLLRATQGETLKIRFRNDLPEPTSIHWHGIRIASAMDVVSPG